MVPGKMGPGQKIPTKNPVVRKNVPRSKDLGEKSLKIVLRQKNARKFEPLLFLSIDST